MTTKIQEAKKVYGKLLKYTSPKYDEEKNGPIPENLLQLLDEAKKKWEYLDPEHPREFVKLVNYKDHKIGNTYTMDGKTEPWQIAYYPITEDGKTGEKYQEPRALIERPIKGGIDFREVPLRYLTLINK